MPYISKHETDQLIGRMAERGFTEEELRRIVAPVRFPDDPTAQRNFIRRAELVPITEREKQEIVRRSLLKDFAATFEIFEKIVRSELEHSQELDRVEGAFGRFSRREILTRMLDRIAKLRKEMSPEAFEAVLDLIELHNLQDDLHYKDWAADREIAFREKMRKQNAAQAPRRRSQKRRLDCLAAIAEMRRSNPLITDAKINKAMAIKYGVSDRTIRLWRSSEKLGN